MHKIIKIIFYITGLMLAIYLSFLIIFELNRIKDFISGNYYKQNLQVLSIDFYSSSGKRNVADLRGIIGNKTKVYLSLYDEDINKINEYVKDMPKEDLKTIKYEDLSNYNFKVPIVKFKNSKKVLLIAQDKDLELTVKDWYRSSLDILLLMSAIFLSLLILKKKFK